MLRPGFEPLPEEPITGTADGRVIGRARDTNAVVPSPDGIYNFVMGYGKVAKQRVSGSLLHQHLSPDRKYDLVWSEVASLVNSVNGLVVQRFIPPADEAPPTAKLFAAALSADQAKVATAGRDKMIRIWNSATGEMLKKFDSPSPFVLNVVFSPDGKSLVVVAGTENPPAPTAQQLPKGPFQISFLDIETGKVTQPTLADAYGSSVAFSASGKYLLIDPAPYARGSGRIRVWDVAAKKDAANYVGTYWSTEPAQFSNDNLLIAAQGDACRLMKPGTGTPLWSVPQAKMPSISGQVSADGLWALIQCSDKTTRLLDMKTGKQLEQWTGVTASTFTPKGQPFMIKNNQTVIVYDPPTLKSQVAEFRSLDTLKPFVAPDGSLALIGPGVMISIPLSAGEKP